MNKVNKASKQTKANEKKKPSNVKTSILLQIKSQHKAINSQKNENNLRQNKTQKTKNKSRISISSLFQILILSQIMTTIWRLYLLLVLETIYL